MKNYIKLKKFSLFRCSYAYVDTADYLADELFNNLKLFIRFGHEFAHREHGFRIIFCDFPKWQERKFLRAMEQLKNKMLICGHGNYIEFCEKLENDVNAFLDKQ